MSMKDKMREYAMGSLSCEGKNDTKETKVAKKSMKKQALIMALKKKMGKK